MNRSLSAALVAAFLCAVPVWAQTPLGCQYLANGLALANGQTGTVQCNADGSVKTSGGGGGGGGGAVYGPNANGVAPSQPPVLNGFQNGAGTVATVSPTAPLPVVSNDQRATGQTLSSALNSFIDIPLNGVGTVGLSFAGLTASGATVTFYVANDPNGTPTSPVSAFNASTGIPSGTRNTDGDTRIAVGGHVKLRLQVTTAGTGSITVGYNASAAESIVDIRAPLPPGANTIGTVTPYSAPSGKRTSTPVTLVANTNTTIAANANRIGMQIQCDGTSIVAISDIGTAITGVTLGTTGITTRIPATADVLLTPDYVSQTAIVLRSAGTPTCVVVETSK